jgi:hypothetical protein
VFSFSVSDRESPRVTVHKLLALFDRAAARDFADVYVLARGRTASVLRDLALRAANVRQDRSEATWLPLRASVCVGTPLCGVPEVPSSWRGSSS